MLLCFIDAIIMAYRAGYVRHDEQKTALIIAARAATDPLTFMTAMDTFGLARSTELHQYMGHILAAPEYYRQQNPHMLGLSTTGGQPESFLTNSQYVQFLVEPVLTQQQQQLFYNAYWWFVRNHEKQYYDQRKGMCIGKYALESRDNASAVARFEDYLSWLMNKSAKTVQKRYADFPADIVAAILKRAFT